MTDTVTAELPATSDEGPDLSLLVGHHRQHSIITTMENASPQLDISTTTAAVAAAQEAQLRDVSRHEKPQPARLDRTGLIVPTPASTGHPPSPTTPAMETHHQHSPAVGPPSESGVDEQEVGMSPPGDVGTPAQICLCQQPARIPRPRNAFILFRQHNHAQVVQQNPGKPNPEISKIIGEMWRESSKETKQIWQKHADEEKRQHLQRFPEYRYQPRRNGKKVAGHASLGLPNSVESAVCTACGGRTGALATPSTPATPMSAVSKNFRQTYMPTPKTPAFAPTPTINRRKRTEEDSRVGVEALLSLGLPEHEEEEVPAAGISHSIKKRRLNELSSSMTTVNEPVSDALQTPRTAQHPVTFGQDSNIDPFLKHTSMHNNSALGESETSPPVISSDLERIGPFSPTSIEDFVRNVPAIDKLRALTKICKPLPTPESSLDVSPRGAIVAIEGEDVAAVRALCDSLADTLKPEMVEILNVDDEIDHLDCGKSKEESNDQSNKPTGSVLDFQRSLSAELAQQGENRLGDDAIKAALYLYGVAQWRLRSNRIKQTVMSQPPPTSGIDPSDSSVPSRQNKPLPLLKLPIILLNRYILSRTDSAACKLGNSDGLSPSQHWQWTASVWRGCVGPDMTILVKVETEQTGADSVEVRDGGKLVIVRKSAKKEWDGGRVRRLGFEVNECVRTLQGNA